MEAYGTILNIVMPIFVILFLVEKVVEWYRGANVIEDWIVFPVFPPELPTW